MPFRGLIYCCATLLAGMALAVQAAGVSTIGTLTCTTSDVHKRRAPTDAKLSCSFAGRSGVGANFTGSIARKGRADLPEGKRVLIWSVLAPPGDHDAGVLSGEYKGVTGGNRPGRLTGGKNGAIVLQPVTASSQLGDRPTASVLRLVLQPLRT